MNTYTIYLPPDARTDSDLSRAKFLIDSKAVLAVLAPPIWLIWHKLWWSLVIYLMILAMISLLLFTDMGDAAIYLSAIPGLYLLLEGNELIRQQHEAGGWRYLGIARGRDEREAEMQVFGQAMDETLLDKPIEFTARDEHEPKDKSVSLTAPPKVPQSIGLFGFET